MIYPRLAQELARFTYRPGWKLELKPHGPDMFAREPNIWAVEIRGQVIDAYDTTRLVQVVSLQPIPYHLTDDWTEFGTERWTQGFAWWLQHALFDVEMHESREWLRRDGELYDDPHKEGARR